MSAGKMLSRTTNDDGRFASSPLSKSPTVLQRFYFREEKKDFLKNNNIQLNQPKNDQFVIHSNFSLWSK